MKRWKQLIATFALVLGVAILPMVHVSAIEVLDQGCSQNGDSSICKSRGDDATSLIRIIVNMMLFVLGMVSVIMIIVGGVRYTTSGGDASSVKSAKDTILYSIIGLIVAILAYAIVEFVTGRF